MADRRGYTSLYQNIPVQPLSGYSDPSAFIRVREAVRGLEDQVTQIRGLVGNSVPGYVSSVGLTAPTIFSVTGSPVTDTGTIALSLVSQTARSVFAAPTGLAGTPSFRALEAADIQSGVFGITRGGTGLSSTPTNGQLLIGNGSGYTLATLTAGTGISITNGVGSIQIDNTLPGFLNPMTTLGDIIYGGAAGAATRLGGETTTTRKFLRSVGVAGAATAPAWDTVTKTDVGLSNVENTALSTWAGSSNLTTLGTIGTGVWNGTKIDVGYGGTGLTSVAANAILIGSTASTLGTIGPPGSAGTYFLSYSSTLPGYQWTNTIDVADGGTGLTSYTVGDLLYASGTTTLAKLAVVDKGILYGTATGPAYTAAADMAWDNTNKRLGIGTATPLRPLHVEKNQNSTTYSYLYNSDSGSSARSVMLVSTDASDTGLYTYSSGWTTSGGQVQAGSALAGGGVGGLSILAYNASGAIRFYTSSTSAFRGTVSSTGQWGFGPDAASPTTLVSIAQYHNAATAAAVFNTDTGANASANLFLVTTATTGLELTSPGATNPNQLKLFSPLSGGLILEASNASGFLAVATGGTYPSSERFRITSAGNVGIGTTTPSAPLHINAPVTTVNQTQFTITDGTTGGYFSVLEGTSISNAYVPMLRGRSTLINGVGMLLQGVVPSASDILSASLGAVTVIGYNETTGTLGTLAASNVFTVRNNATVLANIAANGNVTVDTNTLFVDAVNNRVGIGTTTPATVLDIVQTVAGNAAVNMSNSSADPAANARYILNNSATSGGLQLRSAAHATEPSDLVLYSTANNIRFYTGGNNRMSVGSTGNVAIDTDTLFVDAANNRVGIGTTSAFAKLDFGNTNAVFNTTTPGTTRYGIHFQSDTSGSMSNDYATGITWAGNGTGGGAAQAGIYVQSSDIYGTKMYFATTGAYATGAQTAMTIDQNRRVGIGATTPGVRLDVSETLAVASSSTFSAAAIRMNPVYTATGTLTVKHRYIHFTQPTISGGTPTFTDAHTMYFDAAAGTHRAVDAGTTKTTPGTVNAWVKIDINGTTYYIPAYTSKTA